MRDDTLAHWCAALGIARHCGVLVRWTEDGAEFSPRPVAPDPAAIRLPDASRSPLLVARGRRNILAGAERALELLRSDAGARNEWDWLLDGEQAAVVVSSRQMQNQHDQYSLGTLWPATTGGDESRWAISAWLPVLAVIGASCLDGRLQKFARRPSMHPDQMNTFIALRPVAWTTPEEIARWYSLAVGAKTFELRPVAGKLLSYVAR